MTMDTARRLLLSRVNLGRRKLPSIQRHLEDLGVVGIEFMDLGQSDSIRELADETYTRKVKQDETTWIRWRHRSAFEESIQQLGVKQSHETVYVVFSESDYIGLGRGLAEVCLHNALGLLSVDGESVLIVDHDMDNGLLLDVGDEAGFDQFETTSWGSKWRLTAGQK